MTRVLEKKIDKPRCRWVGTDPLYIKYHDTEWGVPVYDDKKLFEFLILEGAQAGLSWITILKRRENYKKAFDNFDPAKIAKYDSKKVKSLLSDAGIVRNKLKINAAIQNAKMFLEIKKESGSFDEYVWEFVKNKPITSADQNLKENLAKALSKDLLKRRFKFVGPTIIYSLMQAVGMINDHEKRCFRYKEI